MSDQGNQKTVRLIEEQGGRVFAVRCDVTCAEEVKAALQRHTTTMLTCYEQERTNNYDQFKADHPHRRHGLHDVFRARVDLYDRVSLIPFEKLTAFFSGSLK